LAKANNKEDNSTNEVIVALKAIVDSINPILEDIRANSDKRNIQTTEENKVILKEIAFKLRNLKNNVITVMHPNKTTQTKLFNQIY
tara:strand:+ start:928 stop:1185 length:258 start_codon:yes stop_codon:yes gene_type:complete